MNKYLAEFKKLCSPAFFYFTLSILSIVLMATQNLKSNYKYCLGKLECIVPNTFILFVIKITYILFWTFILNILCKSGFKELAWFLVLIPLLLMFVIIGLIFLNSNVKIKN